MEGRCATCNWWSEPPTRFVEPTEELRLNWRYCNLANALAVSQGELPEHPLTKAFVDDTHVALRTRMDFGCLQWEAKD